MFCNKYTEPSNGSGNSGGLWIKYPKQCGDVRNSPGFRVNYTELSDGLQNL